MLSSSQHFPKLLEKTCGEVKCYTLSLGLIISISLARGWVNTFQQFCKGGWIIFLKGGLMGKGCTIFGGGRSGFRELQQNFCWKYFKNGEGVWQERGETKIEGSCNPQRNYVALLARTQSHAFSWKFSIIFPKKYFLKQLWMSASETKDVLFTEAAIGRYFWKYILKNVTIFTGKRLCWSLFLIKL